MQLATNLVYRFEHEFCNGPKKIEEKLTEGFLENLKEEFLDNVFGAKAKVTRMEYIEALAKN